MGTPIKVFGWEGAIEGKLEFPVRITYSYMKGCEKEIKYQIILDPKEQEEICQAIKSHAEEEMNNYLQQLQLANSTKDKAEPVLTIIK